MKKKLYKTVIHITVLTDEPIPEGMDLEEVLGNCSDGDYCGKGDIKIFNEPVVGKNAVRAMYGTGYDPEHFQMDEEGNEIEK